MGRRFSVHHFDNGLTVVLELIPSTVSTALGYCVRTGARNERPRYDGVSHFLEHMMFKGTARRTWQDINRELDQIGARYNAFTDYDETCYYAWVLNEESERALELLSDMLNSTLPPQEFDSEKKVVLEEIARSKDMPDRVAFEETMKLAFAGQRLSSTILGSERSVQRLTRDEMDHYFKARYAPHNLTLFACGNLDEQRLLAQVEKLWSHAAAAHPDARTAIEKLEPARFVAGEKVICKRDVAREHIVVMWPAVALEDHRNIAASLLGAVLGDDRNSRLYWALKHTGLAEDAGAGYWGFKDIGLMTAQFACDAPRAGEVLSLARRECARLKRGIRAQELQRVKNRARTAIVFGSETPFDRFRQLMQEWNVRRELLTPEELLARIDAVTLDDLYDLLEQYPLEKNCAVLAYGPARTLSRSTSAGRAAPAAKPRAKLKVKTKTKTKTKKRR